MTKTTPTFIQFSFYIIFLYFLLLVSHASPQLHHQEQAVLVKLMQYWQISSHSNGWSSANCTPADCSPPADLITCINGSVTELLLLYQNITQVPPFICDLKNLTVIDLSYDDIYGEFPKVFYNCSKLEYLDLSYNHLSGTIHDDIHRISRLGYLNLGANRFSGNIPASIGQLTELTTLQLFNCQFNGSFPLEIGNLSNLEVLHLSDNTRITPTRFPSNFTHLKKLKSLWMSSTNLIGEIPYTIGEMTALEDLDLSRNNLSGEIPKEIGFLRGLTSLNLEYNQLLGRIPTEFDRDASVASFYGNPGVCARTRSIGLRTCKNYSLPTLIISLIIAAPLILLASFFVIRIYRKKKHGLESTWKLTTFQRLNFTESDILSRLTENNVIGSGGSGRVYRVAINRSHDVIAVKRFWSNKKLEEELEREFFAEVRILSSIQHSNIVKLLCCISNDNLKLLVYEYLDNHSLDQWLHGKSRASTVSDSVHDHIILDWPKRLQIAVGVAQGLCYMHHACSPPIVHRDVKSSNILLDSEFNAKVADFGLAKMMITQGEQVTMSTVAGSFGYIAPGV
jgi:Leucine-rich repeat (LRR) protein/tRNA A-37 threonylcarbamoyl transferase component Bud32